MKEEVFPSIGPLVTATASAQYPSAVNMTMVNGIKAKRTPASFGACTKADTKAYRLAYDLAEGKATYGDDTAE